MKAHSESVYRVMDWLTVVLLNSQLCPFAPHICVVADTTVKMQVQVVNVGNTLIKGLEVTVTNLTDLDCKWGLQSATDADVLAAANVMNSTTTEIGPDQKVVCVGTFIFDQAALDVNQNTMVFIPTVVTTSNDTKDTSAPSDYTATASVPIAAVPALVLTVNATACIIPSIIPAGEQSEFEKGRSSITCLVVHAL